MGRDTSTNEAFGGSVFLARCGESLELDGASIATALVLFHRFYSRQRKVH